jgi:hypothetical protein
MDEEFESNIKELRGLYQEIYKKKTPYDKGKMTNKTREIEKGCEKDHTINGLQFASYLIKQGKYKDAARLLNITLFE